MIPTISINKRPSINLSLFTNFSDENGSNNSSKSPRNFEYGVVGLGIVAAMNDAHQDVISSVKTTTKLDKMSKSEPIPIVLSKPVVEKDEVMELSESYTCVVSNLGHGRKKEYFDDERISGKSGYRGGGVFFTSPLKDTGQGIMLFQSADFLTSCYLCKKKLHGLDIFMYRGDKAFCSAECRCKQILSDERRQKKCVSGALKSFDYSLSPCSAPRIFSAGVAAA
ncbi:hypothetical protein IFM89_023860 [Coptis chinensis]|uniref:FLZ-type domain-containing protein n=1 Tax=Coptis chinensis TaxID=261450 RepID=A0A835M9D3_9MAGN|nr:hypothetical protein IFM89_023860 [Coptis chinensis]